MHSKHDLRFEQYHNEFLSSIGGDNLTLSNGMIRRLKPQPSAPLRITAAIGERLYSAAKIGSGTMATTANSQQQLLNNKNNNEPGSSTTTRRMALLANNSAEKGGGAT